MLPETQLPERLSESELTATIAERAVDADGRRLDSFEAISKQEATAGVGVASGIYPGGLAASRKLRKALGQVRAGVGDCKILCIGDSITWGAQGGTYDPLKSWPQQLAKQLNQFLAPAYAGFAVAASTISGSGGTTTTAPRWSAGAGWILSPQGFGTASTWQAPTTTATSLVYTPGVECDLFDVYYVRNSVLHGCHPLQRPDLPRTSSTDH